jgi:hypothetical protein
MAIMRRFYYVMQNFIGLLVLWLCVLLALSLTEMNSLAWKLGGKVSVF